MLKQATLFILVFCFASIATAMHHGSGKGHDHDRGKHGDEKTLEVKNAWIPDAPPSVSVRAGYFMLVNHTDKAITITGAKSPLFDKVEFHESQIKDGLMHMQAMDSVIVNVNSTVHFKPEGKHLMLMQATSSDIPEMIPVTLMTTSGEMFEVMLKVKKKKAHGHHHHDHKHHH